MKLRVHQLAKELGYESPKFLEKLTEIGVQVKSHLSGLTDDEIADIKRKLNKKDEKPKEHNKSNENHNKYVKETLSILEISNRYNNLNNRTEICKFIKIAESKRSLWLKTIENGAILEHRDKEEVLNELSPFLNSEIYQSRKFMNIEKGKFKADISSIFRDYIEDLWSR